VFLHELRDSPGTLPGIGSRRVHHLQRLGVHTVGDLLTLQPRRYEDRSRVSTLVEAARNEEGLVHAVVAGHEYFNHGPRRTLKILIRDETSEASLVCFGRNFLARTFPPGSPVAVYGQFALKYGEIQSGSFEASIRTGTDEDPMPPIVPVYPLTEGISQMQIRQAVAAALERFGNRIEDELPPDVLSRHHLMPLGSALRALHLPGDMREPEEALRRLVWGELFIFQLRLAQDALERRRRRRSVRPEATRDLISPLIDSLPFALTEDQHRVLAEITRDMEQPWPMSRLLQGDVGSGKTLVALAAALHAIERGRQVAVMVPTELLARQHARTIGRLLAELDVHPALALGSMPKGARRSLAAALRDGAIDLLVGTHALFSQDLAYANLGLVIIDEQHRFGVAQREELQRRGRAPDVLMMSATPIPRSLALTAFGDSDVSTIANLPPGRKPVRTHLARMGNDERVYDFVRGEIEAGHQAYMVYPAIDEGGSRGFRSAEERFVELRSRFAPYRVGLAHSRMDGAERSDTMEAFERGEIEVLVATSVVEVGVDVPNATCMVVEHAEVFGLAALHQLRGRVGRGEAQSYCLLVYADPLTEDGRERLKVMYESTDGFHIAEEDLRIRGPGELQGSRQSGFLAFRFADIRRHMKEMVAAREDIAALLRDDPELNNPAHHSLRIAVEALRTEETS
jgi:ATP-dependent DNA helicase RecG